MNFLAELPETVALLIIGDGSGPCLLDPISLHKIDVAGGSFGRLSKESDSQWRACFRHYFGWLMGPPHHESHANTNNLPSLKQRVLRLWAKADSNNLTHCGHLLFVGGNTDRSMTFAEAPIDDVALLRDAPALHRLNTVQLAERGIVDSALQVRPLHQRMTGLREARSACAAVRRPTDGAAFVFGGWDGGRALGSVEWLDCSPGPSSSAAVNRSQSAQAPSSSWEDADGAAGTAAASVADSSTWRWRTADPALRLSTPRCFLGGCATGDGTVWALGGGSSLWQQALCYKTTEFLTLEAGSSEWLALRRGAAPEAALQESNRVGRGAEQEEEERGEDNNDDDDEEEENWETDDDGDDDDDLEADAGGGGWTAAGSSSSSSSSVASVWVRGPDMCHARCGLGASVHFGGSSDGGSDLLYAVGGYGGGSTYHNSAEVLDLGGDPSRLEWRAIAPMKFKRTGCGVAVGADGCCYAVGGSPDGSHAHKSAERFDPREGRWRPLPSMVLGRGYCSAAFALSGSLVVSGGMNNEGQELQSVEVLDCRMLKEWHTTTKFHRRHCEGDADGDDGQGNANPVVGGRLEAEEEEEKEASGVVGGRAAEIAAARARVRSIGHAAAERGHPAPHSWAVIASSTAKCIRRADHASCFIDLPDTIV